MLDYGGVCIHRGKSDWIINPPPSKSTKSNDYDDNENQKDSNPDKDQQKQNEDKGNECQQAVIKSSNNEYYLWHTMLHFFGTVAGPELHISGWDAVGWLNRAQKLKPTIHVSNVDLLFRLPHLGKWNIKNNDFSNKMNAIDIKQEQHKSKTTTKYQEIQFTAPRRVHSVTKESVAKIGGNQVRIQSICSLISSGTELKIFQGMFDDTADAPLDVNIKGMEGERMEYPLAYGYSLVGVVIQCGDDVSEKETLLGKLVFVFSSHASEVVVDRSEIHVVPSGINPFMEPSCSV